MLRKKESKTMITRPIPYLTGSKFIPTLFMLFFLALFLNGCDSNDKSKKKSFTIQQKTQKYTKDTTLKGKVSYNKHTLISGEIKVTDSKDKLVASLHLEKQSQYSIKVPAGTELPLTLSYYPGADSTKKDKLISVAIYTSIKKYDINELTTLIAKKAKELGGYTHSNMVLAADSTVGVPDANKTSTGFRGDPTKQYGGWH
jgi:predicted metalloprotease